MPERAIRPARRPRWLPTLLAAGIGAAIGFGVGAAIYQLLAPVLENSGGLVRELQGLLWNLVPMLTICGSLAGWWLLRRRAHAQDAA